ncbi:MAG: glycosyltransferase [Pseudomonadota bacterium]
MTNAHPQQVVFVLPDLAGGGAQSVMLNLAGALDTADFQCQILAAGRDRTLDNRVPDSISVETGGFAQLRRGLPWLVKRIRSIRPDVVVSVMGYLNLSLLALRPFFPKETRLIVREANALEATLRELPGLLRIVDPYRRFYPRADAVVAPTSIIANQILRAAPAAANHVHVVRNPVDTKTLLARAAKPKRTEGEGLRLVAAGRLTHQKGFDRLLDMASQLPSSSRIDVFGEGSDRTKLQSTARALGVDELVTFRGFTDDLPNWIAGADAFLLPSRWEGLPNVVLESLALGTPAIISDEAAADDLVNNAESVSVTSVTVGKAFVEAIEQLAPLVSKPTLPRRSLLPACYTAEKVASVWSELLSPQ